MRSDIAFKTSDGTTLRGWHYRPARTRKTAPVVVMAHGITAVKEMWLDKYAEVFAAAGLGVLVYDHRNLGASDGKPRQEVDPWAQARDYRDAITFAETRHETDATRIGIWGSSYSGGHVLVVGAIDRSSSLSINMTVLLAATGLVSLGTFFVATAFRLFRREKQPVPAAPKPPQGNTIEERPAAGGV